MFSLNNINKILRSPIFWILFVSFALRVFNLNYNSPFVDEAQYLVLGRKVLAGHWQEESPFSWVGGMPLFYPTLSALAGIFGILGTRLLNVILGTWVVYSIYQVGKKLKFYKTSRENEIVGYTSSLLLGIAGIPIHLSRLATYDTLSFSLFFAGAVHLLNAFSFVRKRHRLSVKIVLLLSSLLFFLSFLAKYIIFPFLLPLVVFSLIYTRKNKSLFQLVGNYFVLPIFFLTTLYATWFFRELLGFAAGQIADVKVSAVDIAQEFIKYTLEYYGLAVSGVLLLIKKGKGKLAIGLFLASFFVLLVHIGYNNISSVYQHTFLSLLFLIPLGSFLITKIILTNKIVYKILVVLVGSLLLRHSFDTVKSLEDSWANTKKVMTFLLSKTTDGDKLLSQEGDIAVLALPHIKEGNIVGPFEFTFGETSGLDAYKSAVVEGYFDYIQLTEGADENFIAAVGDSLSSNYELIYSNSPFLVYSKNAK